MAKLIVSSWRSMLRWLLSSCVCIFREFYTFNSTYTVQIAVYYGGVGHHIQELGEDNLAAFYKVRL